MADNMDAATRSRIMSLIKGADTKPEVAIRKALHARGFRYRLHAKGLPGRPDMAFPRYRAVIFVNGCFWHGHDCSKFRMPVTRKDFWESKIEGNRARDIRSNEALGSAGYRVLTIWECSIRGRGSYSLDAVADKTAAWLRNHTVITEIRGE